MDKEELKCSFCNRPKSQVKHLVQGKEANICAHCAKVCKGLLENDPQIVGPKDGPKIA